MSVSSLLLCHRAAVATVGDLKHQIAEKEGLPVGSVKHVALHRGGGPVGLGDDKHLSGAGIGPGTELTAVELSLC